jgi:hypothetical protein
MENGLHVHCKWCSGFRVKDGEWVACALQVVLAPTANSRSMIRCLFIASASRSFAPYPLNMFVAITSPAPWDEYVLPALVGRIGEFLGTIQEALAFARLEMLVSMSQVSTISSPFINLCHQTPCRG